MLSAIFQLQSCPLTPNKMQVVQESVHFHKLPFFCGIFLTALARLRVTCTRVFCNLGDSEQRDSLYCPCVVQEIHSSLFEVFARRQETTRKCIWPWIYLPNLKKREKKTLKWNHVAGSKLEATFTDFQSEIHHCCYHPPWPHVAYFIFIYIF